MRTLRPKQLPQIIRVSKARSAEVAQFRPDPLERLAHFAAKPDRLTGFFWHAEGIVDMADRLDRAAQREVAIARSP
jgi:hypothetical protein